MKESLPFLAALGRNGLREWAAASGLPAFRGGQAADWIYRRGVIDPAAMANLPAELRERLGREFLAPGSRVAESVEAVDGTRKLLLELQDKETVEMVLIPSPERLTFCLSTQVGCPVRCRFCASGRDGLVRNLAAGEMLEEFLLGALAADRRPDNLVFMGIGEGLLNFEALARTLELLTGKDEFGMSPRRITVSTSGYVPGIRKLAELGREYNLAISLHAPDDETRARLIPDGLRYPVTEIVDAADEYRERAGRMVTFEYTLLAGINDSPAAAQALAELATGHHAKVNLIPYNETGGEYRRPAPRVIREFARILEAKGAHVTTRQERGGKEEAACGQLRQKNKVH